MLPIEKKITFFFKKKGDKNASFGLMGKFTIKKLELCMRAVFLENFF